jgi:hypothetical protein
MMTLCAYRVGFVCVEIDGQAIKMATVVEVLFVLNSNIQIVYRQDAWCQNLTFHLQLERMVELEQVEGFGKHMQTFCHTTICEPQNMGQVILRSKFVTNRN